MTCLLQGKETSNSYASMRIIERSVFSDKMMFVTAAHENGWISDLELSVFESWFNPTVKVNMRCSSRQLVTDIILDLQAFPELIPDGFIYAEYHMKPACDGWKDEPVVKKLA